MPRVTSPDKAIVVFEAAHRLILRGGVEAATVRAIAAEGGMSPSGVRHLFGAQAHLLRCAYWAVADELERDVRLTAYRVVRRLDELAAQATDAEPAQASDAEPAETTDAEPVQARIEVLLDLLMAMLPADGETLDRARLLLAYEARAMHDTELAEQVARWWESRHEWCRLVLKRAACTDVDQDLVDRLDALVAGLTLARVRQQVTSDSARAMLADQLQGMLLPSSGRLDAPVNDR